MEPTEDEKSASDLWAVSPESRRFVLRDGSTWRRLVMRGIVNDPEMKQKWANNREQIRQRQIEAAKQARIYGFGLAGGVTKKASNRKVPEVEPEVETKAPEVKTVVQAMQPKEPTRDVLKKLVLEHRDLLGDETLSREKAEEFLRSKLAERGLSTKPIAEKPPAQKRVLRWAT